MERALNTRVDLGPLLRLRPGTRHATAVRLALALCAVAACRGEPAADAVLPPGQEALFSEMLGGRARLAGGCALDRASLQPRTVTAWYRCDGAAGAVVIELHHPVWAPPGAASAGALSVFARSPEARALGLFDNVSARVRARSPEVRWVTARGGGPGARAGRSRPLAGPPARRVVLGALALGVAIEALRWRARRGAAGPQGSGGGT